MRPLKGKLADEMAPSFTDDGMVLTPSHAAALDWFAAHAGQTVAWAALNKGDQRLAIIPKGIYRPKDWRHSLSIKIIPGAGYPDEEPQAGTTSLRFRYHEETPKGLNSATYPTNLGLAHCMEDGVPIGVIRRLTPKPNVSYKILGLGRVLDWDGGFFTIELIEGDTTQAMSVSSKGEDGLVASPPVSMADARQKIAGSIVRRRGQAKFRAAVIKAYGGRCAISQCDVTAVLEAAHIKPYRGDHTNVVPNSLLLRADLHTLFDLKLLAINPATLEIVLAESLRGTDYWQYHGRTLGVPLAAKDHPALDCLEYAWTAQPIALDQ